MEVYIQPYIDTSVVLWYVLTSDKEIRMTIQEAINSGKRYKRGSNTTWLDPNGKQYYFDVADVLATDWEIEVVIKALSAKDIRDAAFSCRVYGGVSPQFLLELEFVFKELGLK